MSRCVMCLSLTDADTMNKNDQWCDECMKDMDPSKDWTVEAPERFRERYIRNVALMTGEVEHAG